MAPSITSAFGWTSSLQDRCLLRPYVEGTCTGKIHIIPWNFCLS